MKHHRLHKKYLAFFLFSFLFLISLTAGDIFLNNYKFDLTENKIYTLQNSTVEVLSKVKSQISVKVYYSKTATLNSSNVIRFYDNYYKYLVKFLNQYVKESDELINIEMIDPRPDTIEELNALSDGVQKFSITRNESFFFGIVFSDNLGRKKTIPFIDPKKQHRLEYEITKAIYTFTIKNKKKIALISSIPSLTKSNVARTQSWYSIDLLREIYDIDFISDFNLLDSTYDALMVIHPGNLSGEQYLRIEKFLNFGKNAIFFIDPYFSNGDNEVIPSQRSDLNKITSKWGLTLDKLHFVGDKDLAPFVSFDPLMPAMRFLPYLKCDERCFSLSKNRSYNHYNNIMMLFPGKLQYTAKNISPILATTSSGNIYQADPENLKEVELFLNSFEEGIKPVPVAVNVKRDVFLNNSSLLIKKSLTDVKKHSLVDTKKVETNILVFADVDFITNKESFNVTPYGPVEKNQNMNLFLNSVDEILKTRELISLRSKNNISRSFDVIDKIERNAEVMTRKKISQINGSIAYYQKELAKLKKEDSQDDTVLPFTQQELRRKDFLEKLRELYNELRQTKKIGREKVESIGRFFKYLNILSGPLFALILGTYFLFFHGRYPKENE